MKKNWPLILIAISLFLIEISNELTTTGMFLDGLVYSNLAANMAHILLQHFQVLVPGQHE